MFFSRDKSKKGPAAWAAPLRTPEREKKFCALIEQSLTALGHESAIDDGAVVLATLPAEHSGLRLGLSNLVKACAGEPESAWPSIIDSHFQRTLEGIISAPTSDQLQDFGWARAGSSFESGTSETLLPSSSPSPRCTTSPAC